MVEPEVKIIYKSYTPAQKRASQKYYQKNKETVRAKVNNRHKLRMQTEPEYKAHMKEKHENFRQKKLKLKQMSPSIRTKKMYDKVLNELLFLSKKKIVVKLIQ